MPNDAELHEVFSFDRAHELAGLIKLRREWSHRHHLGYSRNWDSRAMDIIRWELRQLERRLREEFGYLR